ncbi:ABC transporter ATP-binding protein [Candidatus Saccharibacteria bacterium]|nr:ABC transporter ATP-binding protein [Candidatus Saccharibacteria bacterium]
MVLLKCQNLSKNYGKKQALNDVNLEITAGKIVGLLGRNGSGKTTLIKLINNLLTPTEGEVLVGGKKLGVESKKVISYLPERTYFSRNMSVKKVLDFFADFYADFDKKRAQKLLKDLDLDESQKISAMSKGMQEKMQLVLVMSRKAKLYILDEPLGGVDPATRDYVLDTILTNFNEKASLIISTHLISDIERILDEVILIDNGKVIMQDEADAIRVKYKASIDEVFRKELKNVG